MILNNLIWGRKGFDGDKETGIASSGGAPL